MRRFNDIYDLKRKNIRIKSDGEVRVWVSQSKNDSCGQGFFFSLTKARFGSLTVADLLRWYFDSFPSLSRSDYIFPATRKEVPIFSRPVPYSTARNYLVSERKCLGLGQVTWHSIRRGFATESAAAGISRNLIKTQGNWKSDCVDLYIVSQNFGKKIGQ